MIIPVSKQNEDSWAKMCNRLWPDYSPESFIRDRARGKLEHEYLYYYKEKPVAFISLSVRTDYVEGCSDGPVAYIEGIFVEDGYRRLGIATEMIDFARNWTSVHGCHALASDCEIDNKASEAFHRKAGFKEVNRIIAFSMEI